VSASRVQYGIRDSDNRVWHSPTGVRFPDRYLTPGSEHVVCTVTGNEAGEWRAAD
jgi:hypothetical protein